MITLRGSLRFQAVASVAVVGALVAVVTVSALGHSGTASSQLDLTGGTAWFGDSAAGTVSLLDGATGSRVSVQPVAGAGNHIQVIQSGTQSGAGAYVVDHTTGDVRRVDGATLEPGPAVRFGPPGDTDLDVVSNPRATWTIEQDGSLTEEVNPSSLAPLGSPHPLSPTGAAPIETPDGSLWTTGAGGDVYSFAAGLPHTRTHPANGRYSLVEADSRPVAADVSTGHAVVLDPRTGRPSRSVPFNPPGTAPLISGSASAPYIIAVGPRDGDLQVTDINSKRSATVVIGDPSTGTAGYGPAVINGDLIFEPDFEQAAVVVAEVRHDQLTVLGQISVDDNHFDLLAYDSSVWFDDPNTNLAGVITPNLTAILIPKTGGNGQGQLIGHLGPVHFGHALPPTPPPTTAGTTPPPTTRSTPPPTTPGTTPPPTTRSTTPPTAGKTTPPPPAPVPGFTWSPNPAQAAQPVTFKDATVGPHRIFQWTFNQGNPITSTSNSPTVTWNAPGTYNVTLVVTEAGQSYAVRQQVTITSSPKTTTTTTSTTTVPCSPGSKAVSAGQSVSWTVPAGCNKAKFTVEGAAGGGPSGVLNGTPVAIPEAGGEGAEVIGTLTVSPGQTFTLTSGGLGREGTGGFNGGGGAGNRGYGGGGMSDVKSATTYLIVAAGGGGDGCNFNCEYWASDAYTLGGASAANGAGVSGAGGGAAGMAKTGGAGGAGGAAAPPQYPTGGQTGQMGTAGQGGAGGTTRTDAGGGGGGRFGGGGGGGGGPDPSGTGAYGGGGGGGGSDLVPAGATVHDGVNAGAGSITVTWS